MKKGDLRRNNILAAAEKLFFEAGYEQTSVQDILDALSMSKGGFYHHFASKESVLQEICEARLFAHFDALPMELYSTRLSPMDKLNLLLRMTSLFQREEANFVALMLKVCYRNNDVRIREHMREILISRILPYIDKVIEDGIQDGSFFTRYKANIGKLLLMLSCDVDEEICGLLSEQAENPECILQIADLLHAYRDSIEQLIGAPYGSILLFDPAQLLSDYREVAAKLIQMEAKGK